jgi:hypothetical protein
VPLVDRSSSTVDRGGRRPEMSDDVTVTCPHCGCVLDIDVEAGVVVGHRIPRNPKERTDFERRLKEIEAEKARAADRMEEAMRREKSKNRLMEEQFRKLLGEASKDDNDGPPPVRDIDLD